MVRLLTELVSRNSPGILFRCLTGFSLPGGRRGVNTPRWETYYRVLLGLICLKSLMTLSLIVPLGYTLILPL